MKSKIMLDKIKMICYNYSSNKNKGFEAPNLFLLNKR